MKQQRAQGLNKGENAGGSGMWGTARAKGLG